MDTDSLIIGHLNKSMSILSRFFYKLNSNINKRKGRCLYRIAFKKTGGLTQTSIHITQSQAKLMKYSLTYKEYFIELWLLPKSEFFISQKTQLFLIDSFPQVLNSQGKLVNLTPQKKIFSAVQFLPKLLNTLTFEYYLESSGSTIGKFFHLNEDAYFCTDQLLGVADGIGSLKRDFGISSKDFSNELMRNCEKFAKIQLIQKKTLNCKEIVGKAYDSMENGGSCTFLLAGIVGRQLNVLNLGDCGAILLRYGDGCRIVMQTTAKIHKFNTPYQITKKFSQGQMAVGKGKDLINSDNVSDADEFMVAAMPGDYLIVGTDGLWDNIYPEEIQKIIDQYKNSPVSKIATLITKLAKIRSLGTKKTPFSANLHNYLPQTQTIMGGKIDDITVIVAQIQIK